VRRHLQGEKKIKKGGLANREDNIIPYALIASNGINVG
jgi:hypothetical protein